MEKVVRASFFLSIISLVYLAFIAQTKLFSIGDVGYLLYISKLMFHGGQYIQDFLETNPPMILYLYLPAWGLSHFLSISVIAAVQIYTICLGIFSFGLCYHFLKKTVSEKIIFYPLVYTLIYAIFFLPVNQFAQREHYLVILSLPYVLMMAQILSGEKVSLSNRIIVGLMAGLGFALKPYFLTTLIMIELYYLITQRNLFAWLRVEIAVILAVFIGYLLSIYFFQPNYFKVTLPLVSRVYFAGIQKSWHEIFFGYLLNIYYLIVIVLYLFTYRNIKNKTLATVLSLATIGFMFSFLMTRAPWFYHVLPAYSYALIALVFFICEFVSNIMLEDISQLNKIKNIAIIVISSMPLIAFSFYNYDVMLTYQMWQRENGPTSQLITYINSHFSKPTSIYCTSPHTCFPLVYYTGAVYGSRYPFFWWLPGVLKLSKTPDKKHQLLREDKQFLIDAFAEDLDHYKTKIVVVNNQENYFIYGPTFNFINYFLTNKKFQQAWSHYHYSTSIGYFDVFTRGEG